MFRLNVHSWKGIAFVLCLMICGGNSQFSFSQVESDSCGSVSGRADITDKATCEIAAGNLGFSDTTAIEISYAGGDPSFGCSVSTGWGLVFNDNDSSSRGFCQKMGGGSENGQYTCLCLSAPECTKINGKEPNTAGCICGTKACSPDSGLFCFKSSNGAARCDKVAHSVAFSLVESGNCGSVSGRGDITDKATCETAAGNLGLFGLSDKTAMESNYGGDPSFGCSFSKPGWGLVFNDDSLSRGFCQKTGQNSSGQYTCLCLSAPECTKINGKEPNNAICICGTKGCSAAGSYCYADGNLCSDSIIAVCSEKDGLKANNAACQCGTTECSAAGSYCVKSSNLCSPRPSTTCAITNGMTSNTEGTDCKCGSSNCKASSGYYCYADGNLCSDSIIAVCSEKDGLTANNAACQCGSTECSSGDYCVESSNSCSPFSSTTCAVTNGTTSNTAGTDCKCGSANCISSSGYYCDASISTCSDISSCSEQDGLTANSAACQCGSTKCSAAESYCGKAFSMCSTIASCSVTDGTTPNSADCQCGTKTCDSTSGLICDSTTSTCSAADCGNNVISNITEQNCKRFNSRCQCSKCKKGWFTKDCSQKCPHPYVAVFVDFTFVSLAVWTTIAYMYFQNAELTEIETEKEADGAANDMRGDAADVKDQGSEIVEVGGSTAHGETIAKQANAARAKAKMFTQKFTQKIKSLQRIVVARMQVLTAIVASIMWKPEVPKFLLNSLKTIGGFFTFDVPGLLSSPDCVPQGAGVGVTPIDKWYVSLFVPFVLMLLVAIPAYYYHKKHKADQNNKDYARMADGWNNVCTQLSFVWIFATVVTTSLSILDCTEGTEGSLIMDQEVTCPLSSGNVFSHVKSGTCGSVSGRVDITDIATCDSAASTLGLGSQTASLSDTTATEKSYSHFPPGCFDNTNGLYYNTNLSSTKSCSSNISCLCNTPTDPGNPGPAVLGIIMLVIYCFGILAFLYTAIKIAVKTTKDRLVKAYRIHELETKARKRKDRNNKREKGMEDIEKMDEIAKTIALAANQDQIEEDEEEEAKDQIEMDQANESIDEIEESDTWKSVGWLMEDYR